MHRLFNHSLGMIVAGIFIFVTLIDAQSLPTGMTAVPIYDTSKAGLSFRKDELALVGMWEVPGKPKHFLVLGYFGYIWTLYPDTTKPDIQAGWGPVKNYSRNQVADFNTWVMKGWETGAQGGAFDPNFTLNHFFYVIYDKYGDPSQYHGGTTPKTIYDGQNNATALVVVDRYKVSEDFKTVIRDAEIIKIPHGIGYGVSNILFGKDGMLYISTHSYSKSSWDSTILNRKVLRIDVSKRDSGLMYHIPTDNPWYNATNPKVRKEVYAFGFRNTYSLAFNYLTDRLYGGETGQGRWEEVNHIMAGKNYGWNNGGDGDSFGSDSWGIEGPCHIGNTLTNTSAGAGYTQGSGFMTPYSRTITGTNYDGTYTCANFENPAWYFGHGHNSTDGLNYSTLEISANVPTISPAFRGDPSSPFYGYMFISDIFHRKFLAAKTEGVSPVMVGQFPNTYEFIGDKYHNGITTWSEDSYGNLYPILLSSGGSGADQWHDIFVLKHPGLTPLTVPRNQVLPIPTRIGTHPVHAIGARGLVANAIAGSLMEIPKGYSGVDIYNVVGIKVWSYKGEENHFRIPKNIGNGVLQVRFVR